MNNNDSLAEIRRTKELANKFRVKPPHERDITVVSAISYVILHIASGVGAVGSLYYMSFNSKVEQAIYYIIFCTLAVLNEWTKGVKMEYFTTCKIISNDGEVDMAIRVKADSELNKAFLTVLVFWVISLGGVGYTGYTYGNSTVKETFVPQVYDENIIKSANLALKSLEYGISQGYSAKTIQRLTAEKQAALEVWNTHKSRIDEQNTQHKAANDDEAMFKGIMYILIGLLGEFTLYHARLWHEKEQYSVLKSRQKEQKEGAKQEKNTKKQAEADEVIIKQSDLEKITTMNKSMEHRLMLSDKTIALLEEQIKK